MKNFKNIFLGILFILNSFNINAQCWFTKFIDDLGAGSTQFKTFAKNNDEAMAAYRIVYNARGASSAMRLDINLGVMDIFNAKNLVKPYYY